MRSEVEVHIRLHELEKRAAVEAHLASNGPHDLTETDRGLLQPTFLVEVSIERVEVRRRDLRREFSVRHFAEWKACARVDEVWEARLWVEGVRVEARFLPRQRGEKARCDSILRARDLAERPDVERNDDCGRGSGTHSGVL